MEKFEIQDGIILLGYEPYFRGNVPIAYIYTDFEGVRSVRPTHGYYAPHPHSETSKKWAKSLGIPFINS